MPANSVLPDRTGSSASGRRRGPALGVAMAVALVLGTSLSAAASRFSYADSRASGIVRQTSTDTCGAAAVATLLSLFFGIAVEEAEIMKAVLSHMAAREIPLQSGVSALSLIHVLSSNGIPAKGFSVAPLGLLDYFARGGLPVIAHVTTPHKHFIVVAGAVESRLVVADPLQGWEIISTTDLSCFLAFSGTILVPMPHPNEIDRARLSQMRVLDSARAQLTRLNALRRRLP